MARINQLNYVSLAGLVLLVGGIIGIALGGYLWFKASDGLDSLDAVYAAQGRMMSYDADGNFTDRGTVAGGDAILSLIEDDYKFPLNRSNLDPNDRLVNTPDELMVQYAIIQYHTLHGTQTVVLSEDVTYNDEFFAAGTYEVPVDGRYFSDLDRSHPIEGKIRDQAWSPLAFGLQGQLLNGMNADYTSGMAHFMSWSIFMGLGFMFAVAGALVTVGGFQLVRKAEEKAVTAAASERVSVGATATRGA